MFSKFSKLYKDSWRGFTHTTPQDFVTWMDENFYLSPDATNADGRWHTHAYQRGLAFLMADLDGPQILNVKKSAQVGYSQILKALAGYECAHRKRTFCCWQPTATDANEFSNLQIKSMLRDCPAVANELVSSDPDKKTTSNVTRRRQFRSATLFTRGATSANEFRRISIETGANDELDGMPSDVGGEGSPDALAFTRMDAALRPKLINGSTPTLAGESLIDGLFNECREKFERYYPCPHCQHKQQLVFGGKDSTHGLRWDDVYHDDGTQDLEATANTVKHYCASCHEPTGYEDLRTMDNDAHWESASFVVDDLTGQIYDKSGELTDERPLEAGIHISGLMSYTVPWSKGVYRYLRAKNLADTGNNTAIIQWTNEYLGEAYQAIDFSEMPKWEKLRDRQHSYGAEVPDWVETITTGWDIGKDYIVGEVVGWGEGERSASIDYIQIMGSPVKDGILKHIFDVSEMKFTKKDGTELPVALTCVDSGYLAEEIYALCRMKPTMLIPVKGASTRGKPIADMPTHKHKRSGTFLTIVGTDNAKDTIYSRFLIDKPGPGYCEFPLDKDYSESYFKGLCSEYRKTIYKMGRSIEQWFLPSGNRAEPLDCRVYALAAVTILQQRYRVDLKPKEIKRRIEKKNSARQKMSGAQLAERYKSKG